MKQSKWLTVAALAALLALGGCSAKRDHVEPPAKLKDFVAEFNPRELWSASVGSADTSGLLMLVPFVGGDTVVAVDANGQVRAYDLATGALRWQRELGFPTAGGVGGGEGLVVISGLGGELVALDLTSGEPRWRKTGQVLSYAPATVAAGFVALRGTDGSLALYDAVSGERRWSDHRPVPPLSLHGTSRPLVLKDAVLAGFDNGELSAYELNSGRKYFTINVALPHGRSEVERMVDVDSTPLFDRGVIYALAYQGRLVAIDAASAQVIWSHKISGFHDMALGRTAIFVTDENGVVSAIDRRSGKPLWSQDALRARGVTGPVLVDDRLVVGDREGYLHWLSTEDGRLLARLRPLNSALTHAPVRADDWLVVQGRDGRLAVVSARP